MSGTILYHSTCYFLRNLKLTDSTNMAVQLAQETCCLHSTPPFQWYRCLPPGSLSSWAMRSKQGNAYCGTITLSTKPSPNMGSVLPIFLIQIRTDHHIPKLIFSSFFKCSCSVSIVKCLWSHNGDISIVGLLRMVFIKDLWRFYEMVQQVNALPPKSGRRRELAFLCCHVTTTNTLWCTCAHRHTDK